MVRGNAFYISVLRPVGVILLTNLTVLLVVMVKLHSHGKRKQTGPFSRLFADTRIAFTCNIPLGCTWVFALFVAGKTLTVFQWFFFAYSTHCKDFLYFYSTLFETPRCGTWRIECHQVVPNIQENCKKYRQHLCQKVGLE